MHLAVKEVSVDKEVYNEGKESFLGTPLWELDDEIKYSHVSSLKKFLHRPDTLYGLGKVIELSIGEYKAPVIYIDATREEVSNLKIPGSPWIEVFYDPSLEKVALLIKEGVTPTPELLKTLLRVALNFYLRLKGPDEVLEVIGTDLETLLGFLRGDVYYPLTYEEGIGLEGLLEGEE